MRLKIICHIMSSVDGRLQPSRWTPPFDGINRGAMFSEYASIGRILNTDAWMFGKNTARESFPYKFMTKRPRCERRPERVYHGVRTSRRLFITVDPESDIFFTGNTLRGDNILTILSADTPADYLEHLEKTGISYILLDDISDLRHAMEVAGEEFGVKSVSLQGGGIIDGAMLAQGLIDELSLVIYPGIDGLTTAPSIFEYLAPGDVLPAEGQALELISVEKRMYGVVWLRYRFHKIQV